LKEKAKEDDALPTRHETRRELMVSRTDDAFPHISPRGLAVAASFNAPYSAICPEQSTVSIGLSGVVFAVVAALGCRVTKGPATVRVKARDAGAIK
jgi:hypothetical protein